MGLAKGFGAIKKAGKRAKERREQMDAIRVRDVYLKNSGEKVKLFFTGDPESEPCIEKFHSIRVRNRFSFERCSHNVKKAGGCVFCYRNKKKNDKRVGYQQEMACFGVAEDTWVHKTKNEEKTAKAGGKYDKFDWNICKRGNDKDKSLCKWCKKGVERERVGQRRLRLNMTQSMNLDSLNDELGTFCRNCVAAKQEPTIRITGFKNQKTGKVLPDIDDVEDPENWEPQYKCKSCKDPQPGSIFHTPIIYKRTGVGKATQYTFDTPVKPPRFADPPEWVQKLDPFDVAASIAPRSADNMAEMLDCENPFSERGGGDDDDSDGPEDEEDGDESEDEEDEDSEGYDEDEEDEEEEED